jgi:predicted DNA-binding transcriptional regulator YafY
MTDLTSSQSPLSEEEQEDVSYDGGLKHEATERILRLLQFLTINECTRQEILEHLATYYRIDTVAAVEHASSLRAERMLQRDLQFLKDQGFEIKKRREGRQVHYSLAKESGLRVPFLFTQQEVDGLVLLYNIFADPAKYARADPSHPLPQPQPQNPFAEEILGFIERLVATLPPAQKRHFDEWVRKPYVYFHLSTVTDYLPHRATINTIVQAISARRQIQFEYKPTHREQEVIFHEHIDPYYIIYQDGHFYLIAYSHKVNRFLEYRVDRIKHESLKLESNSIDVERRRRPVAFRFWIDGNIVKGGLSQRWLTQTLEREEVYLDEQGRERRRVLVHATAYNEWRIIQQLLRYGDKAELVEPAHLRDQMRQVVKRMYDCYEK